MSSHNWHAVMYSINLDRYSGVYSGARFTAWEGMPPEEIDADDGTCEDFWRSNPLRLKCGKGETAVEALADLANSRKSPA